MFLHTQHKNYEFKPVLYWNIYFSFTKNVIDTTLLKKMHLKIQQITTYSSTYIICDNLTINVNKVVLQLWHSSYVWKLSLTGSSDSFSNHNFIKGMPVTISVLFHSPLLEEPTF